MPTLKSNAPTGGTCLEANNLNGESTARKLRSFSELEEGWHYGEGIRPLPETLCIAGSFEHQAYGKGFVTDAFPGIDGEILISVSTPDGEYEVIFEPSRTVTIVREKHGSQREVVTGVSIENVFKEFGFDCYFTCTTSDSSVPDIGARAKRDLSPLHSRTQAQNVEEEYLSSTEIVLKELAEALAATWSHITTQSLSYPSSFGDPDLLTSLNTYPAISSVRIKIPAI